MQRLSSIIRMVARAEGPVLITGKSGTGKELVARALHAESQCKNGPFVAVNCAGIPPALLESELFGHTAQAFTGARKARTGLFEEANGGSLLLDEIGEMPMEMQAKLLRILEDGRIRPVGSNQETQLDVRIIAATNRELTEEVAEGRFREDLYYRLETFAIEVPPLRQRGDDLERIIAHLINQFNERRQTPVDGLTSEALALLKRYPFPGNVRELRNVVERAVLFCTGELIQPGDLPRRLLEGEAAAWLAQATRPL
jgi:transcriptional regulator with PAS, ATPase and Fis domain